MDRRKFVTGALAAPMAGALGSQALAQSQGPAQAQAWPSRNITMIVAFPPGGQADLAARPIALSLEKTLGKSVIVDNRAGAGGLVGNAFVARSEPDGYTLLMALSSMTFLPDAERLYDRKPSYELDSFIAIARALADPNVLCVRSDAPWKSVAELVDDAKKRPGVISFSSSGNYGATHIPFEMFQRASGAKFLHVPYRGGGPAMQAFLGAQVDITAQAPGIAGPHARDGKVRLLAHFGAKPLPGLESIPSLMDLGYKNVEYYIWAGLFAPKGTPPAVITRLREAMKIAMNDPLVTSIFERAGSPAAYMDQPEFAAFVEADAKRLVPVVKSIGRLDEKEK